MSFLKKANLGATPTSAPKLGKKLGSVKQPKEIDIEPDTKEEVKETPAKPVSALGKKTLGTKKLGGGLGKKTLGAKKVEPKVEEKAEEKIEDLNNTPTFEEAKPPKKVLGAKKLAKKTEEVVEEKEETATEPEAKEEVKEEVKVEEKTEEKVEEKKESPQKKAARTRAAKKKGESKDEAKVVAELEVDESKRVTLPEMDTVMRPIVAPTTELWEQEKKDVLDALDKIKVEQDMEMSQVKSCLADLDDLNFEILPKLHDAETMYDGTKQNYDTVKAVAIAKGNATNAEGRKAEGIIACQNFVTPSGAVVDLHQYMLLIEERYKFYQKIADGISFKKYSLVNYNNALKVESKNA